MSATRGMNDQAKRYSTQFSMLSWEGLGWQKLVAEIFPQTTVADLRRKVVLRNKIASLTYALSEVIRQYAEDSSPNKVFDLKYAAATVIAGRIHDEILERSSDVTHEATTVTRGLGDYEGLPEHLRTLVEGISPLPRVIDFVLKNVDLPKEVLLEYMLDVCIYCNASPEAKHILLRLLELAFTQTPDPAVLNWPAACLYNLLQKQSESGSTYWSYAEFTDMMREVVGTTSEIWTPWRMFKESGAFRNVVVRLGLPCLAWILQTAVDWCSDCLEGGEDRYRPTEDLFRVMQVVPDIVDAIVRDEHQPPPGVDIGCNQETAVLLVETACSLAGAACVAPFRRDREFRRTALSLCVNAAVCCPSGTNADLGSLVKAILSFGDVAVRSVFDCSEEDEKPTPNEIATIYGRYWVEKARIALNALRNLSRQAHEPAADLSWLQLLHDPFIRANSGTALYYCGEERIQRDSGCDLFDFDSYEEEDVGQSCSPSSAIADGPAAGAPAVVSRSKGASYSVRDFRVFDPPWRPDEFYRSYGPLYTRSA